MDRRTFLAVGAAATAAACSGGSGLTSEPTLVGSTPTNPTSTSTPAAADGTATSDPGRPVEAFDIVAGAAPFGLGVASGDPDTTSVAIWTRLVDGAAGSPAAAGPVDVRCVVSSDPDGAQIVFDSTVTVDESIGHSVHVVATPLAPATRYYYWFEALGATSPTGRTSTIDPSATNLRVVVASCQNYEDGYFTAWSHAADEDADLLVHLGDAVYMRGGIRSIRSHGEERPTDLAGLRRRWALYRSDTDLQRAHGSTPYVAVWDDNEVLSNYAADAAYNETPTAEFMALRSAAYQAWWEHQPTRLPAPVDGEIRIEREIKFGDLASLWLLDGRQYRSAQVCEPLDSLPAIEPCAELDVASRTMLGADQEQWLAASIAASSSTWHVVAQATVVADWTISVAGLTGINHDQWDGYPAARTRLMSALAPAPRALLLSGDVHLGAVDRVDEGNLSVVEIITPSISAALQDELALGLSLTIPSLPQVAYFDAAHHGYVVVNLGPSDATARMRHVDSTTPGAPVEAGPAFSVDGQGGLIER